MSARNRRFRSAAFSTVALSDSGRAKPEALVAGFSLAFWVAVGVAVVAFAATLVLLRRQDLRQLQPEPAAAGAH